ncbi:hypothetical protein ACP70R_049369 [Stipagrostis hirtigluma subsp. patula]
MFSQPNLISEHSTYLHSNLHHQPNSYLAAASNLTSAASPAPMCLPFCCGGDDPGPQQPTKTTSPTNQREDHRGKGANNGAVGESKNGASDTNKNGGHTPADGGLDADVPPPDGQGPNHGALGKTGLPSSAKEATEPQEHAAAGPRHDAPVAASKPKEASEKMKAPTAAQMPHGGDDGYHSTAAASPPRRHAPVAASQPREAGEKMRNPPVQQMARRREDDDSYPTATAGPRHHGPVVASRQKEATDAADVPAPATGNAHGGHDDHADGHGGQDDRKTWGKSWR